MSGELEGDSGPLATVSTEDELVTQTRLSRILRVTTRTIRNLEAEGLPTGTEGGQKRYPLGACVRWMAEREARRRAWEKRGAEYQAAHREHAWAKARRAHRRWQKVQGRHMPRDVAEDVLRQSVGLCTEKVRRWGEGLAHRLGTFTDHVEADRRMDEEALSLTALLRDSHGEEDPTETPDLLPADDPALAYEASLSAADTVRLRALGYVHEIEGLVESGEVVTVDEFGRRIGLIYDGAAGAIRAMPHRWAPHLVGARDRSAREAVAIKIVADLLDSFREPSADDLVEAAA